MEDEENRKNLRIEELVKEVNTLKEQNKGLTESLVTLQSQMFVSGFEIRDFIIRIEELHDEIEVLEDKAELERRRYAREVKALEQAIKRLNVECKKAYSKSGMTDNASMLDEMDSLRKINRALQNMLDLMCQRFRVDVNLLQSLMKISDGVEDRILQLFLDGLRQRVEDEPEEKAEDSLSDPEVMAYIFETRGEESVEVENVQQSGEADNEPQSCSEVSENE